MIDQLRNALPLISETINLLRIGWVWAKATIAGCNSNSNSNKMNILDTKFI
jgi:hypothetical protein